MLQPIHFFKLKNLNQILNFLLKHFKIYLIILLSLSLTTFNVFAEESIEESINDQNNSPSINSVTIGGYGELHYNQTDQEHYLDFHRFVLFFGYTFNEYWSLKSELEIEHNLIIGGEDSGEVELEQAHVNFTPFAFFNLQGGVILVAAGLINENHEPPLFLSSERPLYHGLIIPTTWFGNGFRVYGKKAGFHYRLAIMEGLNGNGISLKKAIRSARGKGLRSKVVDGEGNRVNFKNPLYNFYLQYTFSPKILSGLAGLKIGGSATFNDAIHSKGSSLVQLWEGHLHYQRYGWTVIGEYGYIGYTEHPSGLESSLGYYFDLGYNVLDNFKTALELTIWGRYSYVNTALTISGKDNKDYEKSLWRVGFSFKPISEVALKIDYGQVTTGTSGEVSSEINAAIGYYF